MNIPIPCTDFFSLSVHLKYWFPVPLEVWNQLEPGSIFSIILVSISLTYTDIAGGRKARPYQIWTVKEASSINRRRRGGVYPRPYCNLICSG